MNHSPMYTVPMSTLAQALAAESGRNGVPFTKDCGEEILAAVAQTYLERIREAGHKSMTVQTEYGLSSSLLSAENISKTIVAATGATPFEASKITTCLDTVVKDFVGRAQAPIIYLEPLGEFSPVGLSASRYNQTFRDPRYR